MKKRCFSRGWWLAAILFFLASIAAEAALVARWVASDLPEGAFSVWNDRISSRPASGLSGITKNSSGVLFDGSGYCEVPAANNPVAGDTTFSVTVVARITAGATRAGLTPTDPASWWGNATLVGRELPGGNRGDWGLAANSAHQAIAGRGNPDGGVVGTTALNDNKVHVISAVFNGTTASVTLFVNGTKIGTATGVGITAIENETCYFGVNILGTPDTTFFKGSIQEIQFEGEALDDNAMISVQNGLLNIYRNSNVIQSFTATPTNTYEGKPVLLKWKADTNKLSGGFSYEIAQDNTVIHTGNSPTNEFQAIVPDLQGENRKLTYTFTVKEIGGNGITTSASVLVSADPGIPFAIAQRDLLVNAPQSLNIRLTGSDPNGGTLQYLLSQQHRPAKGSLSGTPPNVSFTPFANARGDDSFSFRVSDGKYESEEVSVRLTINPSPTPPAPVTLDNTNILHTKTTGDFVANIATPDANLNEGHSLTLVAGEGSDHNARFTISGSQLLAATSFGPLVGTPQKIRIRSTDSLNLFSETSFVLQVVSPPGRVLINEIHYNGVKNEIRNDFIELHNSGTSAVNLAGWRLSGAVDFLFPAGTTIPPGGFLIVAEEPGTIASLWGKTALGPYLGKLSGDGETVRLRNALDQIASEVDYQVGFPWPVVSSGDGASMELLHPSLDESLGSNWRPSVIPARGATTDTTSIGAQNLRWANQVPPAVRQVEHSPKEPRSDSPVIITAKVTDPDGVKSVELLYQVVAPGKYLSSTTPRLISGGQFVGVDGANPNPALALNADFEKATNWSKISMSDNGRGNDRTMGDSVWVASIPAQAHRTLVRYRVQVTDNLGHSVRVPYVDDATLNFAYFVYNGVPNYFGTSSNALTTLPTYHFLTPRTSYMQSVGYNTADRITGNTPSWQYENWMGTFVYDGKVYDHVRYRLHGGNGRYFASGNNAAGQTSKRAFKFVFNKGALFEARDQDGRKYPEPWKTVVSENLWENKGTYTFSLNEVVNFELFNLLGVPSLRGHFSHFRTIMQLDEQPDPYLGDFWGLMYVHEDYDNQFLKAHDLPDGNLYKLTRDPTNGLAQLRHQGAFAVANGSDHDDIELFLSGTSTAEYVTNRVNLKLWSRYHALCEAVRHYDYWPSGNNNAAYYFYPTYTTSNEFKGVLWYLPSDLDATWGPSWNNGHDVVHNALFNDSVSTGGDPGINPLLWPVYHNEVRELRDLLWQPDQINPLIDQYAAVIRPFVNAEFKRWKGAPATAGNFNGFTGVAVSGADGQAGLDAYVADMKDFAFDPNNNGGTWPGSPNVEVGGRAAWLDTLQGANGQSVLLPNQPTITFIGAAGFPINDLKFQSSDFNDPQGPGTFGGIQWRVAEVNDSPTFVPGEKRKLEIVAAHDTGWIPSILMNNQYHFPMEALEPGKRYRARVRHFDNMGIASKWSLPVEFTAKALDDKIFRDNLWITEIMYHPAEPTAEETSAGTALGETWEDNDFEYVELMNLGTTPLDLKGISFVAGVSLTFSNNTMLAAGARAVVVANPKAFAARYGTNLPVVGAWSADKSLGNGGDTIRLAVLGASEPFRVVSYEDDAPWPKTPDGEGPSLVLISPESKPDPMLAQNWRASFTKLGSPGVDDRLTFSSWAEKNQAGNWSEDSDGDGIINLVEFALGGNPKQSDRGILPVAGSAFYVVDNEQQLFLTVTFNRLQDTREVSFEMLFAPVLGATWQATGVLVSSTPLGDGYVREVWRAPVSRRESATHYGQLKVRKN